MSGKGRKGVSHFHAVFRIKLDDPRVRVNLEHTLNLHKSDKINEMGKQKQWQVGSQSCWGNFHEGLRD